MTNEDLEKIRARHEDCFTQSYFKVVEAGSEKVVVDIAINKAAAAKRLGLTDEDVFARLVEDVRAGRNTRYRIFENFVDVRDPSSSEASTLSIGGKRLTRQEAFDYHVMNDVVLFVNDELRKMENHLALPKERQESPKGFKDWADFKSYYKSLERWSRMHNAGMTKTMPPLMDGVVLQHSGKNVTYETPMGKAAQIGCGMIGIGWFVFIGVAFLLCIVLKFKGCFQFAPYNDRNGDAEEEAFEQRWH